MHHKILTASSDKFMLERLERIITGTLADSKVEMSYALSGDMIKSTLGTTDTIFNLIIIDVSSFSTLETALSFFPSSTLPAIHGNTPIICITGENNCLDVAIALIKAGASDLISFERLGEELPRSITNALHLHHLQKNLKTSSQQKYTAPSELDIIGEDISILHARKLANRAARSTIPVFIQGEPGTGKELFARYIYLNSERNTRPFVCINASSLPDEILADPIIFGAVSYPQDDTLHPIHTPGKLEEANGGTLFIREIGRLPISIQAKLVHSLKEKQFTSQYDQSIHPLDIRIISSSSENLEQQVAEGRFLKELYYMLNVYPISLPPLRERKDDIHKLILFFYSQYTQKERKKLHGLTPSLLDKLVNSPWPGNVRQLKNSLYRSIVLTPENTSITEHTFPQHHTHKHFHKLSPGLIGSNPDFLQTSLLDEKGGFLPMRTIEQNVIEQAITYYDGHMSEVARRLKIGRSTLYRKMEEMGIAHPKGKLSFKKQSSESQ